MKIIFIESRNVGKSLKEDLWSLYSQSYCQDKTDFDLKSSNLDGYALYYDNKKLVGYTGIRESEFETSNGLVSTIYFGQTVILKKFRGRALIQRTVISLMLKHKIKNPLGKLIFWNDSLSYRPFLVLAKGNKNYYPHINGNDPQENIEIRNQLGDQYYGKNFCEKTGVVHKAHTILKQNELNLSPKDLKDPYISFFVQKNPKYAEGNGLITFVPATFENLNYYLTSTIKKGIQRRYGKLVRQTRKSKNPV